MRLQIVMVLIVASCFGQSMADLYCPIVFTTIEGADAKTNQYLLETKAEIEKWRTEQWKRNKVYTNTQVLLETRAGGGPVGDFMWRLKIVIQQGNLKSIEYTGIEPQSMAESPQSFALKIATRINKKAFPLNSPQRPQITIPTKTA